jgi:hypothetical protein
VSQGVVGGLAETEEQPDRDAEDGTRTGPRAGRSRLLSTVVAALTLGVLLQLRYGYSAGAGDHFVLSPTGVQWADPTQFQGDWAVAAAPQPHISFDVLTWLGASTGTLSALYLLYWVAGLLVFGYATAVVVSRWVPRLTVLAPVVVATWVGLFPDLLLGTGTPALAIALPGCVAGFQVYLVIVALLEERDTLAAVTAAATAVVHVQQGAVAAVLLLLVIGVRLLRRRRPSRSLVAGVLVTVLLVLTLLSVRGVASDTQAFAQICDELIPYHCNAATWTRTTVATGGFVVLLGLLTVLALPRSRRPVWLCTLMLPAAALAAGIAASRYDLGVLGTLAEGTNVFRLAVIFVPWSGCALLLPFVQRDSRLRGEVCAVLVALVAFAALGPPGAFGSSAVDRSSWWMLAALTGVLLAPLLASGRGGAVRDGVLGRAGTGAAVLLLVTGLVMSAAGTGALQPRPLNPSFGPDPALNAWGRSAQAVIAPGETVITPPTRWDLRMALRRAIVVDCKYVPYGGEAWQEFRRRITDVTWFLPACTYGDPGPYRAQTPERFAEISRTYGARYLVLDSPAGERLAQFTAGGWTVLVDGRPKTGLLLLGAPAG